jgi:hypothetical protein
VEMQGGYGGTMENRAIHINGWLILESLDSDRKRLSGFSKKQGLMEGGNVISVIL